MDDTTTDLVGKKALVTGGTTGIGKAIAIQLAQHGGKVLIFGRDRQDLNDALTEIGENAVGVVADQSKPAHIEKVFAAVDKELGGLDILINNAAIGGATVDGSTYDDISYIVQTNVVGCLTCCMEGIPRLKKSGGGHIVNIGSMSAHERGRGGDIYVATKTAIEGFTDSLRKQVVEYGIRVTLIEPGRVETDMTTSKTTAAEERKLIRQGEMLIANDIASAVIYALRQPKRCAVNKMQIEPILAAKV